jgi:hypothetical protein
VELLVVLVEVAVVSEELLVVLTELLEVLDELRVLVDVLDELVVVGSANRRAKMPPRSPSWYPYSSSDQATTKSPAPARWSAATTGVSPGRDGLAFTRTSGLAVPSAS